MFKRGLPNGVAEELIIRGHKFPHAFLKLLIIGYEVVPHVVEQDELLIADLAVHLHPSIDVVSFGTQLGDLISDGHFENVTHFYVADVVFFFVVAVSQGNGFDVGFGRVLQSWLGFQDSLGVVVVVTLACLLYFYPFHLCCLP